MADKEIKDLTAISTLALNDIYEVSANGTASYKETREQNNSYRFKDYTGSSTITLQKIDLRSDLVLGTDNSAINLLSPGTGGTETQEGYFVNIKNISDDISTIRTPLSSTTKLDGFDQLYIQPGESVSIVSDGDDNYYVMANNLDYKQSLNNSSSSFQDLKHNGGYIQMTSTFTYNFEATIVGADSTNSRYASFKLEGCIRRNSSGTVAFVGTPMKTIYGRTNVMYDVQVIADDTNKRLTFQAASAVGEPLNWAARIKLLINKDGI